MATVSVITIKVKGVTEWDVGRERMHLFACSSLLLWQTKTMFTVK